MKLENIISSVPWTQYFFVSLVFAKQWLHFRFARCSFFFFFFNIIFLPENKGNPVSKVPDASASLSPKTLSFSFRAIEPILLYYARSRRLDISISPHPPLVRTCVTLCFNAHQAKWQDWVTTRVKKEKETKYGARKTVSATKTLSQQREYSCSFFFCPGQFGFLYCVYAYTGSWCLAKTNISRNIHAEATRNNYTMT